MEKYTLTPVQLTGLVRLLDSAFSEFNHIQGDWLDITFDVRSSGVVHFIGHETSEFTNLPSCLLGCVTPTGVVHDYTNSPYELHY